jgi:hypothetical protein
VLDSLDIVNKISTTESEFWGTAVHSNRPCAQRFLLLGMTKESWGTPDPAPIEETDMQSLPLMGAAVDLLTEATETGCFIIAPHDPPEKWEAADQLLRTYFAQEDEAPVASRGSTGRTGARLFTLTPYGLAEARSIRSRR